MEEYLDAAKHLSKRKKKGWRVAELGRSLERAFQVGNKVVRLGVHDEYSGTLLVSFYFTPITDRLRKAGEKLGNYLHSLKTFRRSEDSWWVDFRAELEDMRTQLEIACTGTLLGPPLMKPGDTRFDMMIQFRDSEDAQKTTNLMGNQFVLDVQYLEGLPSALEPNAHVWNAS